MTQEIEEALEATIMAARQAAEHRNDGRPIGRSRTADLRRLHEALTKLDKVTDKHLASVDMLLRQQKMELTKTLFGKEPNGFDPRERS